MIYKKKYEKLYEDHSYTLEQLSKLTLENLRLNEKIMELKKQIHADVA